MVNRFVRINDNNLPFTAYHFPLNKNERPFFKRLFFDLVLKLKRVKIMTQIQVISAF